MTEMDFDSGWLPFRVAVNLFVSELICQVIFLNCSASGHNTNLTPEGHFTRRPHWDLTDTDGRQNDLMLCVCQPSGIQHVNQS
jgi:hypothetical protein